VDRSDEFCAAQLICLQATASVPSVLSLYGKEKEKKHQDEAEKQVALKGQDLRRAPELTDT
jgi:hypothetical protein